jgi:hypothetical protein
MKTDVRVIVPLRGRWVAARASLAVGLSLGVLSLPVRACCDDFLSCAAAVATGGLSCAAEAAIKAVEGLIDSLQQHQTDTTHQMNAVLDAQMSDCRAQLAEFDARFKQNVARIEKANQDAGNATVDDTTKPGTSQLAVANGTSVATKAKPKVKNSVASSLSSSGGQTSRQAEFEASPTAGILRAELAAIVARQKQSAVELAEESEQAQVAAQEAQARARVVMADNVFTPLVKAIRLCEDALSHPWDIDQDWQDAAGLLKLAEDGFEFIAVQMMRQTADEVAAASHVPEPVVDHSEKEAQRAEAIAGALHRMTAVPAEADRAAIAQKLDEAEPKSVSFKPGTPRQFSAKMQTTLQATFTKRSAQLHKQFAAMPKPATKDTTAFRQKISGDFDTYFKGVTPAAGRKKREELIAEAKIRYAKDPDTLKALVNYLREEASARGVN